jgi:hypothetical protein
MGSGLITGIHVSLCQEKARVSWARSGERAFGLIRSFACALVPLGWWSLLPAGPDSRVLHAVADRLLVNVKSDVVHIVSEEPPR